MSELDFGIPFCEKCRTFHDPWTEKCLPTAPEAQEGYSVFVPQGIRNGELLTTQADFKKSLELLESGCDRDTHLHCSFSRILEALRIVSKTERI